MSARVPNSPEGRRVAAERELQKAFLQSLGLYWAVFSLRRFRLSDHTSAVEGVGEYVTQTADAIQRQVPGLFTNAVERRDFISQGARTVLYTSKALIDAASLVFAHSIFGADALEYCKVGALVDPEDWSREIAQRTAPLADLRSGYDQIRDRLLAKYVGDLDRESLPTRVQKLLAHCHPLGGWASRSGFDLERIKTLDVTRHRIVHEAGFINTLSGVDEELQFIQRMDLLLVTLLKQRYGFALSLIGDPEAAARLFGGGGSAGTDTSSDT